MIEMSGDRAEWAAPHPPQARGPLSAALSRGLTTSPESATDRLVGELRDLAVEAATTIDGDDAQLSLWLVYQLHYRGLSGVDDRWEWHPVVMAVAGVLERALEDHLRTAAAPHLPDGALAAEDVPQQLAAVIGSAEGPSLSGYLARHATREQFAEFLLHRSVYHLLEADSHSWAIPRLSGPPKVALVEIQADEYGGGRPEWMHATLFADTMRDFGLDTTYGHYLDSIPAVTLLWANTMSLFGLHRRLRGAVCGHLAALEMTSSLPNRRLGNGLRRLEMAAESTTRYFDEHVEADAVHEQIAAHDMAAGLARQEPGLIEDILFGAVCATLTDAALGAHLLSNWKLGARSLVGPADGASAPTVAGAMA